MANTARKKPSSAREDYLKAIYRLDGTTDLVPTTALARELGVSKPSVTAMAKQLAKVELAEYVPHQGVRLTAAGRRATLRVVRRHRLLEAFLVEVLGLDWSEVHEEAEVLEHHLSDRMVEAIDRVLGHPREDPHGHPIPDADGKLRHRDLDALAELLPGVSGVVREVRSDEAVRLQRWKELGLVPGARVRMEARQDMEDVMHIDVDGRPLVTGSEGVDGVYVEVSK